MRVNKILVERIETTLAEGNLAGAAELFPGVTDYHDAEEVVRLVLGDQEREVALLDLALETFLASRQNRQPEHGYWVHSLSHFTKALWERRLVDWIARLNEVAFQGALVLGDTNCSERLIGDFADHAAWADDPVAFHLSEANLRWATSDWLRSTRKRLAASPFVSEEAYLRWRIANPDQWSGWHNEAQRELPRFEELEAMLTRLGELGVDTAELGPVKRSIVEQTIATLEAELRGTTADWLQERLRKAIAVADAALDTGGQAG